MWCAKQRSSTTLAVCHSSKILHLIPTTVIYDTPITPAMLPSPQQGLFLYGATAQVAAWSCSQSDRLLLRNNNDYVVLVRDVDCTVMLAGKLLMQEYNDVILGLSFRSANPTRSIVQIGYVYWSDAQIRDMVVDMTTMHVYSAIEGLAPIAGTTANNAHAFCAKR